MLTAGTTQIFLGTAPLRCAQYINANRIDGLAPPGMGTQAVIADDTVAGNVPSATVPFQYLQDGGVPVNGPAAQANRPARRRRLDAATDDAGCPGAP